MKITLRSILLISFAAFALNAKAQPAADAWPDMFISPSTVDFCPDTIPIIVSVNNNSLVDINTIELSWTINGNNQLPVTYSSTIAAGMSASIQLDPGFYFESGPQTYDIEVTVGLVNGIPDSVPSNDVLLTQFMPYQIFYPQFYWDGCRLELSNFSDYDSIIWLFNGAPDPLAPNSNYYTPIQSGSYGVMGIMSNGCTATIDSVIPLNPPAHQITALGLTTFCDGDSVQLTYTSSLPLFVNNWSNGSTLDTTYASTGGWFYLTAILSNSCAVYDSIQITVHPLPVVSITDVNDTLVSTYSGLHQWYFNGSPISGAHDSTYVPTQQGTYFCIVTTVYGCIDTSNSIIWIMPGISRPDAVTDIMLYPNPATDFLEIRFATQPGTWNMMIVDAVGKVVRSESISGERTLDISNLEKGIYQFVFTNGEKQFARKLVKTN